MSDITPSNQMAVQAVVDETITAIDTNAQPMRLALFTSTGDPLRIPTDVGELSVPMATTTTAGGTAAKTTTAALPAANTIVGVKFNNGNTANAPTITFATGAAMPIKVGGTAAAANQVVLAANAIVAFWFDGSSMHILGVQAPQTGANVTLTGYAPAVGDPILATDTVNEAFGKLVAALAAGLTDHGVSIAALDVRIDALENP